MKAEAGLPPKVSASSAFQSVGHAHHQHPRPFDVRHSWAKALGDAGLEYFWIYSFRHTFASRMSAAGASDLFVGQMIGHKTPGILQKYSRAVEEYRRDAVRKLETMRAERAQRDPIATTINRPEAFDFFPQRSSSAFRDFQPRPLEERGRV
jgi:hypothetical protein